MREMRAPEAARGRAARRAASRRSQPRGSPRAARRRGGAGLPDAAPVPARPRAGAATLGTRGRAHRSCRRRACARSASSRCATSTRACCATAPAAIRPTTAASPTRAPGGDAAVPVRRSAARRRRPHAASTRCARRPRHAAARSQAGDFEVYADRLTRPPASTGAAARHELVDELGGPLRRREEGGAGDGEPDPRRATRATTSRSSASSRAPSSSGCATCPRRAGTWATRSPTCRTACASQPTCSAAIRATNQHMIVITDGQPTAYFPRGRLYCEWPLSFGGISMRAAQETLKEVERVTRNGITINTFMLDDSPRPRAFVERMTHINRGAPCSRAPTVSARVPAGRLHRAEAEAPVRTTDHTDHLDPCDPWFMMATISAGSPRSSPPMLEQYLRAKQEVADALLVFRLGDFYELFFEDAETRGQGPRHHADDAQQEGRGADPDVRRAASTSVQGYVAAAARRRVQSVALCDQLEDASLAKGIVTRGVVRIVTPGTVTEEEYLDRSSRTTWPRWRATARRWRCWRPICRPARRGTRCSPTAARAGRDGSGRLAPRELLIRRATRCWRRRSRARVPAAMLGRRCRRRASTPGRARRWLAAHARRRSPRVAAALGACSAISRPPTRASVDHLRAPGARRRPGRAAHRRGEPAQPRAAGDDARRAARLAAERRSTRRTRRWAAGCCASGCWRRSTDVAAIGTRLDAVERSSASRADASASRRCSAASATSNGLTARLARGAGDTRATCSASAPRCARSARSAAPSTSVAAAALRDRRRDLDPLPALCAEIARHDQRRRCRSEPRPGQMVRARLPRRDRRAARAGPARQALLRRVRGARAAAHRHHLAQGPLQPGVRLLHRGHASRTSTSCRGLPP